MNEISMLKKGQSFVSFNDDWIEKWNEQSKIYIEIFPGRDFIVFKMLCDRWFLKFHDVETKLWTIEQKCAHFNQKNS